VFLKIEPLAGYSPLAPVVGSRSYGRDGMFNAGHEIGRVQPVEIAAASLDALVYREYLDNHYMVPNTAKLVEADLNEPSWDRRVPGAVLYAEPGERLHIHVLNGDPDDCHSLHVHGVKYGIESDGAWPFGVQTPYGRRSDEILPGHEWTYTFDVTEETIGVWAFHDHTHMVQMNVNRGLFGALIVRDPKAPCAQDVPMFVHAMAAPSTADSGFESPPLRKATPKQTYEHPFTTPGVVPYHCKIHGLSMSGTVVVDPASPAGDRAVDITDNTFTPATVSVRPGNKVVWTLSGNFDHIVLAPGGGAVSYCLNGRAFIGNTPTIEADSGTRLRWHVLNLDLGSVWHNFHPHSARWQLPTPPGGAADVHGLSPAEGFTADTVVPAAVRLPAAWEKAQCDPPDDACRLRLKGDFLFHCHLEEHMMAGLAGLVRARDWVWVTQELMCQSPVNLPLYDPANRLDWVDLMRCGGCNTAEPGHEDHHSPRRPHNACCGHDHGPSCCCNDPDHEHDDQQDDRHDSADASMHDTGGGTGHTHDCAARCCGHDHSHPEPDPKDHDPDHHDHDEDHPEGHHDPEGPGETESKYGRCCGHDHGATGCCGHDPDAECDICQPHQHGGGQGHGHGHGVAPGVVGVAAAAMGPMHDGHVTTPPPTTPVTIPPQPGGHGMGMGTTMPGVDPIDVCTLAEDGYWELLPVDSHVLAVHAALMHTGQVLFFAGSGNNVPNFDARLVRSVVWDYEAGTFYDPGCPFDVFCAYQTALADGKILVAGGTDKYDDFVGAVATYLFDPTLREWIRVDDMDAHRWYPTLVTMGDGRAVVVSGIDAPNEIFDPKVGWRPLPKTTALPLYPHLFLLRDGRIFYTGGQLGGATVEPRVINVLTGAEQPVTGLRDKANRDQGSSVLLPPAQEQRFLVIGGSGPAQATNHTDLVDLAGGPAGASFHPGPDLAKARGLCNSVILPDRTVLITGGGLHGETRQDAVHLAEIYDPATNTLRSVAEASVSRLYHSVAFLLPDGRVATAGSNPDRGDDELRLEVYHPPYLFRGPRPLIEDTPTEWRYGTQVEVLTPSPVTVRWAHLLRPMATTHSNDTSQRLVDLPIVCRDVCSITVDVTEEPNLAPPGWYMLFLVDDCGIPSEARWVHLDKEPPPSPVAGPMEHHHGEHSHIPAFPIPGQPPPSATTTTKKTTTNKATTKKTTKKATKGTSKKAATKKANKKR
jgi:plastocyanin